MIKIPVARTAKEIGEWAELQFMAKAATYGLRIAKAWGDSARYDVIVEGGGRLLRVQVKSTAYRSPNSCGYVCSVHPNSKTRPYTRRQFDFLAAYVIPEDVWYIIPSRRVVKPTNRMIVLSPSNPRQKYRRYKEAWHLLTRNTVKPKRIQCFN